MQRWQATWPDGTRVQWRSLSWGEFRRIEHIQPVQAAAVQVYKTCVTAGPAVENVPAGVMMYVAEHELVKSPYSREYAPVKISLDRARQKLASSWMFSARALVAGIFRYSFEEIDTWDAQTFMDRVAQAEMVSGRTIDPADPKAPKNQPKTAKKINPRLLEIARKKGLDPENLSSDVEHFEFRGR